MRQQRPRQHEKKQTNKTNELKKNPQCSCGKFHKATVDDVVIGSGALRKLPGYIKKLGANKPFLLADVNTFAAAGDSVCKILSSENIPYGQYVFSDTALEPDEKAVGAAI